MDSCFRMSCKVAVLLSAALASSGCGLSSLRQARTSGESATGYGYVPVDPLPVRTENGDGCIGTNPGKETNISASPGKETRLAPVLTALPDITVRFAVADFDQKGNLNFGPAKITESGSSYRAVLDYINVDTVPIDFLVRRRISSPAGPTEYLSIYDKVPELVEDKNPVSYEAVLVKLGDDDPRNRSRPFGFEGTLALSDAEERINEPNARWTKVTVPVYVGVGLRLIADIRALKGNIALSGLGSIGAQAEADALSGTLAVQTLGVNGKAIALALPLPNKLDQTTIETGILAIGGARAVLYSDADNGKNEEPAPRIVGIYSPIGTNAALINALYSELSKASPVWKRKCISVG